MIWWRKFNQFKKDWLLRHNKWSLNKDNYNLSRNNWNRYSRYWRDSHQLNNKRWYQFINKHWIKNKSKFKVWKNRFKIMRKLSWNIKFNFRDYKNNFNHLNWNFLLKRKDNNRQDNKKRVNKIISKLFYQIKGLQVEGLI